MNASDDPWAASASSGQGEPPAAAPPPAAHDVGQESDSWASTSAPGRIGPGSRGPADTAGTTTCYLLHFDRPYIGANGKGMARHYSGSATDLQARLAEHDKGQGARLLQVVKAAPGRAVATGSGSSKTRAEHPAAAPNAVSNRAATTAPANRPPPGNSQKPVKAHGRRASASHPSMHTRLGCVPSSPTGPSA